MKKWIWRGVVLAGVVAMVIFVIKTPARGKITYKTDRLATPTPMEYIRYDSPVLSFSYKNKYQLTDNGISFELVGNSGISDHIMITANVAKTPDIEEIPGLLMRRVKKDQYTEEKINWGEIEGVLFKNTAGTELTAFFLKNGRAVTVAMTTGSNDETGFKEEFQKLVDSMEIKVPSGV